MTVPAADDEAARRLADGRWRLRHSLWTAPALLGFGLLTWVSFGYAGAVARRRGWLAAGVGYAVVLAVVLVALLTGERTTGQLDPAGLGLLALWFVGGVHAVLVNRRWLAERAGVSPPPSSGRTRR
ncbi:hypothetical protein GCM10027047_35180 [Rhodococcus aerolatus]